MPGDAGNQQVGSGMNYDSANPSKNQGFGYGWLPEALATLEGTDGGGALTYMPVPGQALTFLPGSDPDQYDPAYFIRQRIVKEAPGYKMLDPDGTVRTFHISGLLLKVTSPGKTVETEYTYGPGGHVSEITTTVGTRVIVYGFAWTGDYVTSITYAVAGRAVLQTRYTYDSVFLQSVKIYENSTVGTGTPDWGTRISCTRFSYHEETGLLRHVVPPSQCRQMLNNGIDPDTATETQLNAYAMVEYDYGDYNRVRGLYTHGRRYNYLFSYAGNPDIPPTYDVNTWISKTDVTQPDGSLHTYYYNQHNQLLLEKISDSATSPMKVWYRNFQQFDSNARRYLSADSSAIQTVDEEDPQLVTLKTDGGYIEEYSYDLTSGNLGALSIRNGSLSPAIKLKEWTYEGHQVEWPVSDTMIWVTASETVYPDESGTGGIVTSYSYTWHSGTSQINSRATALPSIPTTENGTNASVTRSDNFDVDGFLTSSYDERGTRTTYTYDKAFSALKQRIVDEGTGKLNLQTDYKLDERGRVVRELGPAHDAIVAGASVNVRSGSWTYYLDREGKRVTFQGYLKTSDDSEYAVGPVTVSEPNLAPPSGYSGWRLSSSYDAKWTAGGIPSSSTTYPRTDWVRWTLGLIDEKSVLKERWTYFDIPSSGYGTQSTNYGKKLFAYDYAGRLNQTTCAGGTVDKTTYNAMDWAMQEELGTSAGLTVTRMNEYDAVGNLTTATSPVDSTAANDRVKSFVYDWRNRRVRQSTVVEKEGGGTWTLIKVATYDNRDLVVAKTSYRTTVATGNRTSYEITDYDKVGRPYRTKVYGVDGSGTTANPQESNVYYLPGGLVARNAPSGSKLFTITTYDAVGRTLKGFQAYEPSGFTPGSDPSSVANAVVMEQQEFSWDADGNSLSIANRARFDNASTTATGELGNSGSTTQPKARVSYVANYFDGIGRGIATANYGTYGAASWSRPSTVPTRSDDVLVNSTEYDAAGNAVKVIDPASMETTRAYDASDRLITLTENAAGSGSVVRVTHCEYTDDGWLKKLKCDNSSTGQQVTEWIRGVTPAQGSALYSNRLVYQKVYPDSTGGSDLVTYTYNRQLEITGASDQVGTVHAYGYDKLGRLLTDAVTTFGTGIDNYVGKLENAYDERGWVTRSTSYGSGASSSTKRNEVVRTYNDFNQLTTEYQEHGGAVNTSTSPKVQYSYADGSANTVRPTGLTYPNSTAITTSYTGTQAGYLSRPDQVKEGSTVIASMRYLGLSTLVGLNYDAASNLNLTYQNGGTGVAGDQYTGLDRFGRIVETIWIKGSADVVQALYGYNRASNILWRRDDEASSTIAMDNYFEYDGLQQVTAWKRGNLSPNTGPPYTGVTSKKQGEDFTYDQTGNWLGDVSDNPNFTQNRTHNKANEIASISGPTGVIQPVYDAAGNMTTAPSPGDWATGYAYRWDAWNRLVEIKQGSTVVGAYAYDALTRRTKKTVSGVTRDIYYDNQWRSVEEREGSTVKVQHTWSPIDRWTLIRRKRNATGSTLNETLFCLRDNLDPVALADTSGAVVERYNYDAFGTVRIMNASYGVRSNSAYDWTFLFHGEFIDNESGLYNYGYRYYDAQLGRWLSRDPLGEKGGLRLYVFVENNPPNFTDVFGLFYVNVSKEKGYITGDEDHVTGKVMVRGECTQTPCDCLGTLDVFVTASVWVKDKGAGTPSMVKDIMNGTSGGDVWAEYNGTKTPADPVTTVGGGWNRTITLTVGHIPCSGGSSGGSPSDQVKIGADSPAGAGGAGGGSHYIVTWDVQVSCCGNVTAADVNVDNDYSVSRGGGTGPAGSRLKTYSPIGGGKAKPEYEKGSW